MELATLVEDFAAGMKAADARLPRASSRRSSRVYKPGIGPHAEDDAVELVVRELRRMYPERYAGLRVRVPYPNSRQKCDLVIGLPPGWAIEVKMARFSGDNGKPDDTSIKDILSPYDSDRSAVTDCAKLAGSGFATRVGLLIYGFEDERRPLDAIIESFETLARLRVSLSVRNFAKVEGLVHPVFSTGRVFAWEILLR